MVKKICTVKGSAEPTAGVVVVPKPKARPRGGSRKGIPNRLTADVRSMVLAALEGAGGKDYLQRQAVENPNAFLSLLAKTMPTKIVGDAENPVGMIVAQRVELDFALIRAKREVVGA